MIDIPLLGPVEKSKQPQISMFLELLTSIFVHLRRRFWYLRGKSINLRPHLKSWCGSGGRQFYINLSRRYLQYSILDSRLFGVCSAARFVVCDMTEPEMVRCSKPNGMWYLEAERVLEIVRFWAQKSILSACIER
jgi:hypothetical protein